MSRDKQIEEMQEMASILTEASHLACEDIPLLPTDTTMCDKIPCHRCKETRLLRYKGYRKASDVAREIFEDVEKHLKNLGRTGYVGNMSGILAELKKKYLGEDINAPTKESEGEG